MVRYFIDFEYNGHGGALISCAITRQDGDCLYLVVPPARLAQIRAEGMDPWVAENVVPVLYHTPLGVEAFDAEEYLWGPLISDFIYRADEVPQIFADWMSDIAGLMKLFITGPGEGVPMNHQTHMVCLRHLDVYPTTLKGAVQHNAAWDTLALKRWLDEMEAK